MPFNAGIQTQLQKKEQKRLGLDELIASTRWMSAVSCSAVPTILVLC